MIVCVYLAAGLSTRLQGRKLLLPFEGKPLGSWALQAAMKSRVEEIVVVTREEGIPDWMSEFETHATHMSHAPHAPNASNAPHASTPSPRLTCLPSPNSHLGQSHSVIAGVRAAQARGASAVLLLLADQPLVTVEMINRLLDAYQSADPTPPFAAASCEGIARPPCIISQTLFPELLALSGDQGARKLLRAGEGLRLPFDDPLPFFDVDTAEDYHSLLHQTKRV
ncbi:nucleotidyltransferase family protein [Tumebacillus flagellatus]|uniref:MobA-like NTP transferase domain-containing protein n=1 Tax=Tumebacillus flagellatus TaxID=1157490 RepID=A0A074LXU4_9BACL|nr:nucleotidyltransferase family protein [Tumebacillus flagellatus]KEO85255.1 hypothetical protein EL26_01470 [Tumebacillus flagellatus]